MNRRPDPDTLPAGRAYAGPPAPGARMWKVAVLTCPLCSTMHTHRAVDTGLLLSGNAIRTCPTTGREYVLRPVQRRAEARRSA